MLLKKSLSLFLFVFGFFFLSFLSAETPSVLYLSWMHDPTTTMVIYWHTDEGKGPQGVLYREKGIQEWETQEGVHLLIPKTHIEVHTLELTGLKPDTTYEFSFGTQETLFLFRTLPATLKNPLKFAIGGDVYGSGWRFRKMAKQVAKENPRFCVLGGDIAYTHGFFIFKGRKWQVERWQSFFKDWLSSMKTPDGHLIPMIPVLGNHDIRPTTLNPLSDNLLFYEIFLMPNGVAYRTLDVGHFLSFFLLDTGHSSYIEGIQTTWLEQRLLEREDRSYKFAVYHVGAYPSVYSMDGGTSTLIRKLWSPLFEKYQVQMAFEHHNHAYKRTKPLIQEKEKPNGVIYMGDGSWGVSPRKPKNRKNAFFAKTKKVNAVNIITLEKDVAHIDVISPKRGLVDAVEMEPHTHQVALDLRRISQY